jgi:hypothetical protein
VEGPAVSPPAFGTLDEFCSSLDSRLDLDR